MWWNITKLSPASFECYILILWNCRRLFTSSACCGRREVAFWETLLALNDCSFSFVWRFCHHVSLNLDFEVYQAELAVHHDALVRAYFEDKCDSDWVSINITIIVTIIITIIICTIIILLCTLLQLNFLHLNMSVIIILIIYWHILSIFNTL